MEDQNRRLPGCDGLFGADCDPATLGLVALPSDEIHLWLVDLDQPPRPLAELAATLAADEWQRAERFRCPDQRHRFIAGRGLLRTLLGAYLGCAAATLRLTVGPHGKPGLADADADAATGLQFNLSHSAHRALYAVAWRDVGVDVECLERRVSHLAVLERICTPREWALFQAWPTERLQRAFFACWTRKEAIAKAQGDGLAGGLRQLEVCWPADGDPEGRMTLSDTDGRIWSVLNLPLEAGWSGALAASGADWRWRGWDWR
ncbi:MAG: 4'-phosphopantetheinyl transferase superfamily protein [Candidatus Competibacteraceae bacterium]|nr:MAG: 4'-phosphopantetheinyl transferase superfamily protein [Candidatus Competibacteraceae bacterium]